MSNSDSLTKVNARNKILTDQNEHLKNTNKE